MTVMFSKYVLCSILIGLVIIYKYTLGHVYLYYYILLLACYYVLRI